MTDHAATRDAILADLESGDWDEHTTADADPPFMFGGYLVLRRLGQGGMGEVFLAKQGNIGGIEKYCVVKTIRSSHSDTNEYIRRFIDEARVVVQLGHRNICHVFDVGRVGRQFYMAMERIEGQDLRAVLDAMIANHIQMQEAAAVYLAGELLDALDYAHRHKDPSTGEVLHIVHRDISPHNVMVNYEGEAKLIDFGLAASTLKVERTEPRVVMGKMTYMAPEQARGDLVDGRADLFAIGVCLYEMLAGERYYEGKSFTEVWQVVGRGGFTPSKWFDLHPGMQSILQRALHPDPAQRYQTGAQFKDDLDNYRFDRRLRASTKDWRALMGRLFGQVQESERAEVARLSSLALEAAVEQPAEFTHTMRIASSSAALSALPPGASGSNTDSQSTAAKLDEQRGRPLVLEPDLSPGDDTRASASAPLAHTEHSMPATQVERPALLATVDGGPAGLAATGTAVRAEPPSPAPATATAVGAFASDVATQHVPRAHTAPMEVSGGFDADEQAAVGSNRTGLLALVAVALLAIGGIAFAVGGGTASGTDPVAAATPGKGATAEAPAVPAPAVPKPTAVPTPVPKQPAPAPVEPRPTATRPRTAPVAPAPAPTQPAPAAQGQPSRKPRPAAAKPKTAKPWSKPAKPWPAANPVPPEKTNPTPAAPAKPEPVKPVVKPKPTPTRTKAPPFTGGTRGAKVAYLEKHCKKRTSCAASVVKQFKFLKAMPAEEWPALFKKIDACVQACQR